MRAYIIRRLLLIIPTVFVASMMVFFLLRFVPGSAIELIAAQAGGITEDAKAAIEHELGLDRPVHVQYVHWISNMIMHGDFGKSLWTGIPVHKEIVRAFPITFEVGLLAFIVGMLIAIPIGMYSAVRQDTWGDYVGRSFAIASMAVPGFWLGTMVVVFPSMWWGWSPPIMLVHFTDDPLGNLQQFIVPAVVLGMGISGVTMRMTRNMMLEVLRQDYIRTAWSKGLKERVVVVRHALKNAFIPVVTLVGLYVPVLVGGAVVIEQIFCLPGMGRLIVDAAFHRDYPVITGVMLFMAVFILLVNVVVDVTYSALDPRIQYG